MTDLAQTSWTEVDASNNQTPPNGWPANMLPNAVEPSARMMMGAIKRSWNKANPVYPTTQSTADSYVFTPTNAGEGWNLYEQFTLRVNIANASTSPTMTIGSVPFPIQKMSGSSPTVLAAGDMRAQAHTFFWDGSRVILRNPTAVDLLGTTGSGALVRQTSATVGGAWVAGSTWTLPALTLGGTLTMGGQTISGAVVFNNALSGITSLAMSGQLAAVNASTGDLAIIRYSGANPAGLYVNYNTASTIDLVGYTGAAANAVNLRSGGSPGDGLTLSTANLISLKNGLSITGGAFSMVGASNTIEAAAATVSTNKISINVNGTTYKFLVTTV